MAGESNKSEIEIELSCDDSDVTSTFNRLTSFLNVRVIGALKSVRKAIGDVMSALGTFGLAMQGVQFVVDAFKKLNEWMHRAETAAKALREELAKQKYDAQVAHAAAAYEKLTKRLAEVNRLERERNDILKARKQRERDLEDANLERSKQQEIAQLDPAAADYAERRKGIERKYDLAAGDVRSSRAKEDARAQVKQLYSQAAAKDAEANELEGQLKKQERILAAATERSWAAAMKARNGGETENAAAKEAAEEENRQYDKTKKIRQEIDKIRQDAQSIRNQAAEIGSGLAANITNQANRQRIENEAKAEAAAKAKKEADEKTRREQNLQDAQRETRKEQELAALNPGSSDYDRRKREIERKYELLDAEEQERRAENDEDRAVASEKRKALLARQGRERAEEDQAHAAKGAGSLGGQPDAWRPSNRLTAMGLDSGSGADRTGRDQAKNVEKLVKLVTEQVELARQNRNRRETAKYAP